MKRRLALIGWVSGACVHSSSIQPDQTKTPASVKRFPMPPGRAADERRWYPLQLRVKSQRNHGDITVKSP